MNKLYTLMLATSVFISTPTMATQNPEKTITTVVGIAQNELQSKLAEVKSFYAEFSQTVLNDSGQPLMQGSGIVKLKYPEMLYWLQTSPDETLLVSNGAKTVYFDEFAEQATLLNSEKLVDSTPFALLTSNNPALWQRYKVVHENSVFTIEPIAKGESQVERLLLTFDGLTLTQMTVFDNTGQQSKYSFMKQVLNPQIDNADFTFTIPEGVFVDDQSQSE